MTKNKNGWVFQWKGGFVVLGVFVGVGWLVLMKKSLPLGAVETDVPAFGLKLMADREVYFHDGLVEMTLQAGSAGLRETLRSSTGPWVAWVEKDGKPVVTIGEMKKVRLRYDKASSVWRGKWPIPWNAPDGAYDLKVDTAPFTGIPDVETKPFVVKSRRFKVVPAGFGVVTLEGLGSLSRFPGPRGIPASGESMAQWAEFMGADAVLLQGAESSGYSVKLSTGFPWQMRSVGPVVTLAKACQAKGISLGVYVLSYMVGGPAKYSPDYDYGWNSQKGHPVYGLDLPVRRGISIRDERRPGDIVKVLNRWAAVEGVDFVGLDYIRPVFGGNELADDFVNDMPGVEKPEGYDGWSKEKRMSWVAQKKYLAPVPARRGEGKYRSVDQWFWYRAHRTAGVMRRISEGFGGKKPLWAFTLSWNKGWEHGQDPAMMRDAGVDMNGIMLYETDGAQFRGFVKQWKSYTGDANFNLVLGDTFDWNLHQKTLNPSGPESLYQRTVDALEGFQTGRPARGMFVHDLARGLRGRLGPYSPTEWVLSAGAALTRLREIHGVTSYTLTQKVPEKLKPNQPVSVEMVGTGISSGTVSVELFSSADVEVSPKTVALTAEKPSALVNLQWKQNSVSAARGNRVFFASRATRSDRPQERCQIHVSYAGEEKRVETPVQKKDSSSEPTPESR